MTPEDVWLVLSGIVGVAMIASAIMALLDKDA